MAQKPRSRKHEDRLCRLECQLANLRNEYDVTRANLQSGRYLPMQPRTFWQKLNDYLSR